MSSMFLLIIAGATIVVAVIVIAVLALIVASNNRTSDSFTPFDPTEPASMPFNAPSVPNASTADFQLTVEDAFSIKGRGTVVTGRVETGVLATGQRVRIGLVGGPAIESTVLAIESFQKKIDSAKAGDNVGLLLEKGIEKDQVQRGMIVTIA